MYLQLLLLSLVSVTIIRSEVVDKHFTKCNSFFYQRTPPRGFDDDLSAICQRYENSYHFATLYSSNFRIPMYSAYTLDLSSCPPNQPKRRSKWFIEPQLSGSGRQKDMTTEGSLAATYMRAQAINIDYPNTNYDRGHLNPNFYQCNAGRTATFTLTNAVPQDPCFNQQIWKDMEKMSKDIMTARCNFAGAKRYFVTGAVPSRKRIPSELDDKEGDEVRIYNRVSVPSIMWTAACCDSSNAVHVQDKNKGFSFGYYGENVPDSYVIPYTVDTLERTLASKYGIHTLDIFADSCFSNSETTKSVLAALAVPVERKIAETLVNMAKSSESSLPPAKRKFIETVNVNVHKNDAMALKNWRFVDADFGLIDKRSDIQGTRNLLAHSAMTTILTCPAVGKVKEIQSNTLFWIPGDSIHGTSYEQQMLKTTVERQQVNKTEDVIKETSLSDTELANEMSDQYIVVPSQESTLTATGSRCRHGHSCDYHGYKYKWCYTDWSKNWDYCCIDACGFGQSTSYSWCYTSRAKHWAYCSQRSSMITISGKPCRADHECGTHSRDSSSYYWCYTDTNQNWDYCCQPWHECAKHGSSYKWCYVGNKKKANWHKCYY
ncbi:uncharacterized protein LOC123546414 [Mercenaria mercenaria]|uniref:uncharacterized protein LOC123546414 n=1 Tax=Mercenaria mercenaria TaxID=6596 RepID=UPI00234F075D|nr:uncharacterized protein LOC123546414 [Mercenaria mercenaria]